MKTKTLNLLFILIIGTSVSYAQLNPIKNLQLTGFYGYPDYTYCPAFNCFSITWEMPEASFDTLLGYKIYKNNEPWRFETSTFFECMGMSPCLYNDIYDSMPCTIKVSAIYDEDSLESERNDSVYIESLAIGLKKYQNPTIKFLTNPIRKGELIKFVLPTNMLIDKYLVIASLDGRIVYKHILNKSNDGVTLVPSNNLEKGIYIISLQLNNSMINSKLIIE
jgi:hypothetical protein